MAQSPPFNIAETSPGDADFIRLFPANERLFRDIVESWLTRISDAATGYPKAMFGTDAERLALSPAPGDGTTFWTTDTRNQWIRVSGAWVCTGIQPGTLAVFAQETAPLGWTKVTDSEVEDAILLLDNGDTGGDYLGTTSIIAATLTQAMLPNVNFSLSAANTGFQSADHTHGFSATTSSDGAHIHEWQSDNDGTGDGVPTIEESGGSANDNWPTLSAGAHTHTVSGTTGGMSASHTHSLAGITAASGGSGSAFLSNPKRVICILCSKD